MLIMKNKIILKGEFVFLLSNQKKNERPQIIN